MRERAYRLGYQTNHPQPRKHLGQIPQLKSLGLAREGFRVYGPVVQAELGGGRETKSFGCLKLLVQDLGLDLRFGFQVEFRMENG